MPITHQIVTMSNDTGYYTGVPYNYFTDKGTDPTSTTSTTILQACQGPIWMMKSVLKTAGWVVAAWGSGSTTGIYSDPMSSSLSLTTDHGWFMMKHPISSRSFILQKAGPASASNEGTVTNFYNNQMRVKYSPGGFAITGTLSAKNTPGPITGSDELTVFGGGTDNLPTYAKFHPATTDNPFSSTAVWHCVAQTTGNFGFVLFCQKGGTCPFVFGLDPIITVNTGATGDLEPYVVHCSFDTSNSPLDNNNLASVVGVTTYGMNSHNKWTWVRRGFSDQVSGAMVAGLSQDGYHGDTSITAFGVGKPPTKNSVFLPLYYVVSRSAAAGSVTSSFKGISTMFKCAPYTQTNFFPNGGQTFSVYSMWDIAQPAKGTVLPWFGVKYEAY